MQTAPGELDRPAFYALRSGGWRDLVTLLHPPYTAWHLSYVALGAAAAPHVHAVRLGAGRTDRGSFAGVQHTKLDPGLVGGESHGAAQRIDFLHQVPLADPTDRRVTRHLAEGFNAMGEQQCSPTCPRGGERSLRSGVASAYHNYLEAFWEHHVFK